jgi:uncharacterized protein YqeY
MVKERLQTDLQESLRRGDGLAVSTLRMVLAAIVNRAKEKRIRIARENPQLGEQELALKSNLTDEEILEVLFSEAKKRREAIGEFEKGKREDLAEKERAELEIIQKYLPEQLSEEEIKQLAQEVIQKTGALEQKDVGRVMAALMPRLKGKADGGLVKRIVSQCLHNE